MNPLSINSLGVIVNSDGSIWWGNAFVVPVPCALKNPPVPPSYAFRVVTYPLVDKDGKTWPNGCVIVNENNGGVLTQTCMSLQDFNDKFVVTVQ